ncbi:hypothetical protein WSM22_45140 [Cytophagales bacterium WSM2-2]|nr:hypothetical protein WSM22_45140 [Cytophagales bacterium WSM2-2]
MIVALFVWSCEDPTTLAVSKVFSTNKLQSVYVDTFSVVTSIVQLDTLLTHGTGAILLGKYKDPELGMIEASSYFQVTPNGFANDRNSVFDSMVLVLAYNHDYLGDTSVAVKVNVHQLTQQMVMRTFPNVPNIKYPAYNISPLGGFYNSSKVAYNPVPLVSANLKYRPRRDTVTIRMPDALGKKWFSFSQYDSGRKVLSPSYFVNNYFYGLHLNVDPSTNANVIGFKTSTTKLRFYYKRLVGNTLVRTHYDFPLSVPNAFQFNHIDYDRTGTALANLDKLQALSTRFTNHTAYIQAGTGLVTRLDFPTLKNFLSINNGVVLNAAYLEIYPVRGSYPKNFLPPNTLQLYTTDQSNLPLFNISGGTADLQLDYEHQVNTFYRYQVFQFVYNELKSSSVTITPLILGPVGQGSNLRRLYFGDRFYPNTQIKLKLYYSYVLN